jgi:cytochrome c556
MRTAVLTVLVTACFVAACDRGGTDTNASLSEANATGEAASNAVENAVAQTSGTPLEKQQALALMKERHENYERIGDAMKVISRELKGDSPDLAAVRQNAAVINELAPRVPTWFPAGTGPDVGKTHAKAEVWQKPDDFAAKARDFQAAALAFNTAARGTDVATIRTAQANLGKSCKACHDVYRAKDD